MEQTIDVTLCSMNGRKEGRMKNPVYAQSVLHGQKTSDVSKRKKDGIATYYRLLKNARRKVQGLQPIMSPKRFGGYKCLTN